MGRVSVVGAGIFGVTAAIELAARGHRVTLHDPGPIPHPLAESTDISKIVRIEYGDDEAYTAWMEEALPRWRSWPASSLFHETGVMFLRHSPFEPGSFEGDSFALLTRRGHVLTRLDKADIQRRYPAWSTGSFVDGYYNPIGGWAESGRAVSRLAGVARDAGVVLAAGAPVQEVALTDAGAGSRVAGVRLVGGHVVDADFVVVTTGAWAASLVPALTNVLHAVGQPVFHLRPVDTSAYAFDRFPVFGADIARTGYYGFPVTRDGIVKIANHGVGRPMGPDAREREVPKEQVTELRRFLHGSIPGLAEAPLAGTRICVYGDTFDQHFLIAPHPDVTGLVVATGGSGHAFKFAPLLGPMIADALEGKVIPRFAWRSGEGAPNGQERARYQGPLA